MYTTIVTAHAEKGEAMELELCPFCGGEAVARRKISFPAHGERVDEHYISCVKCGAKGPAYDAEEDIFRSAERTAQKAADAWNRRI